MYYYEDTRFFITENLGGLESMTESKGFEWVEEYSRACDTYGRENDGDQIQEVFTNPDIRKAIEFGSRDHAVEIARELTEVFATDDRAFLVISISSIQPGKNPWGS